jgi:hypothetical protein
VAEFARSEGKIETALDALRRLEHILEALNSERVDLLDALIVRSLQASVFDGLESVESIRFQELSEQVEEKLAPLISHVGDLNEQLNALCLLPFINWHRSTFSSEKNGNWVRWHQFSFNLKVAHIEQLNDDTVSVAEIHVPYEVVKPWNVFVAPLKRTVLPGAERFQVRQLMRTGAGYHHENIRRSDEWLPEDSGHESWGPPAYDVASVDMTLSTKEIQQMLADADLKSTDLILQGDAWIPLENSMHFAETASQFRARDFFKEHPVVVLFAATLVILFAWMLLKLISWALIAS